MHSPQPATRDTAPSREPASDSRPLSRLSKGPSDRRHTPAASDPWGGRMTPPTPPLRGRDRGTTADSSKLSKLRTSAKLFFRPRPAPTPSSLRTPSQFSCNTKLPSARVVAQLDPSPSTPPPPTQLGAPRPPLPFLSLPPLLQPGPALSHTPTYSTPVSCSPRSAHIETIPAQPSPAPHMSCSRPSVSTYFLDFSAQSLMCRPDRR